MWQMWRALFFKAPKELKGFEKVFLKAGEEKTVEIHLDERAFSYYDTQAKAWRVESGKYLILVGSSSRDIRLTGSAQVWNPCAQGGTGGKEVAANLL